MILTRISSLTGKSLLTSKIRVGLQSSLSFGSSLHLNVASNLLKTKTYSVHNRNFSVSSVCWKRKSQPSKENKNSEDYVAIMKDYIPRLPVPFVAICGLFNMLLIPGLGTILASTLPSLNIGNRTDSLSNSDFFVANFCVGLLQYYLSPIVIGWVWSCYWVYLMYEKRI